jgi:hypothetical protein
MVVSLFSLVLSLFTYDQKNKVNRFLVGLPVGREKWVLARYLFAVAIAGGIILLQGFLQWVYVMILPGFSSVYDIADFLLIFCLAVIILAICFPLLYFNYPYAMALLILLLSVGTYFTMDLLVKVLGMTDEIIFNDLDKGFGLLVETYIPFSPIPVVLCVTLVLYWISLKLSIFIFARKGE